MKHITTPFILGWIFLIASFFSSFGVFIICASIFFSANYIIEKLDKNGNKN